MFLATEPALADRPVVLKVTARDGLEHLSLAQLRHPNIVPLYCAQDLADRGLRLLCMPYLGGAPLGRLWTELSGTPIARRSGLKTLVADVLSDNNGMLRVFRNCGLPVTTQRDREIVHLTLALAQPTDLAWPDHRKGESP